MRFKKLTHLLIGLSIISSGGASLRAGDVEKWFFAYVDLLDSESKAAYPACELRTLIPDLKRQGYRVIVLASFQFGDVRGLDPNNNNADAQKIQKNLRDLATAAKEADMKIIPEVMPVGTSESILQNDYNLAEGTPVSNLRLQLTDVSDGRFQGLPSAENLIKPGSFSGCKDEMLRNWNVHKDLKEAVSQVKGRDDADGSRNALLLDFSKKPVDPDSKLPGIEIGYNEISLQPRHQYRLSFWLKTEALGNAGTFYARVSGSNEKVTWHELERVGYVLGPSIPNESVGVESRQDWTKYEVLLNSFDYEYGRFWFGFRNQSEGQAWIADVELRLACGPNLLRRSDDAITKDLNESLPLIVKNVTTNKFLCEKTDFEAWEDKSLGKGYSHSRPDVPIRFLPGRVSANDEIEVCYYHASLPVASHGAVCCSLRHPRVLELFREQVSRINAIVQPTRWQINHDEIRGMGHDPLSKGDSPANILMENFQKCTQIIKDVNPSAGVVVFSGMYDPFHDAVDRCNPRSYFPMVNGDFGGTQRTLDRSITVLNWQTAQKALAKPEDVSSWKNSLQTFARTGCPQVISAFYDVVSEGDQQHREESVRKRTRKIFEAAVEAGIRPAGVCYYSTHRGHQYTKIFAETADAIFSSR